MNCSRISEFIAVVVVYREKREEHQEVLPRKDTKKILTIVRDFLRENCPLLRQKSCTHKIEFCKHLSSIHIFPFPFCEFKNFVKEGNAKKAN